MDKMKRRSWWLRILVFTLSAFLILFLGSFFLNRFLNYKIRQSLSDLGAGINVNYSNIRFNLLTSSLSISKLNLSLQPDSETPKSVHQLQFNSVECSGIHTVSFLFGKKMIIDNVTFSNGECLLDHSLIEKKQILPNIDSNKIPFKSLTVGRLDIQETNISVRDLAFCRANFSVGDIHWESKEDDRATFGLIKGRLVDIMYRIPGTYYTLQINKLGLDSKEQSLTIDSCKISTSFSKLELGRHLGHQVDYLSGNISKISLKSFDIEKLLDKKLIAGKLEIRGEKIYVFRDRRLTRELIPQPLPVSFLRNIPVDIHIDTVDSFIAEIESEEFPKGGTETGILKVERAKLFIVPLINRISKSGPNKIEMTLSGSIMGSGEVTGKVMMPMDTTLNNEVTGEFKDLDLTKLNPSAENLGKFHIESGLLNDLRFDFNMNAEKSDGKIVGVYHDLVIQKLKGQDRKVAKIPTFVLKHVIIPKNKEKSLPVAERTGKVDYTRDPTRYISYYLLQSLLTGIKSSFTFGFLIPQ